MAFGIQREELSRWKSDVANGKIAFLTHYWLDERFPDCYTVTKVGCSNISKLIAWGSRYNLKEEWIDQKKQYPHFDLFGVQQKWILTEEKQWSQLKRFNMEL